MKKDRRMFLATVPALVVLGTAGALLTECSSLQEPFPPNPSPLPPLPRPFPGELPAAKPELPDPHLILKENQKQLKKEVKRLAELVEELQKLVAKTDSSEVLSLDLVHKAEEIEKAAKHIASLAKG